MMKKYLVLMVALFAMTMTAGAQTVNREYKFSNSGDVDEKHEGLYDRRNPYVLERDNGGDWYKVSDDRVVIWMERYGYLNMKNYTKKTVNFYVTYHQEWKKDGKLVKEWAYKRMEEFTLAPGQLKTYGAWGGPGAFSQGYSFHFVIDKVTLRSYR